MKKKNNYKKETSRQGRPELQGKWSPVCWDTRESWMCAISCPYKFLHIAYSSQKLKLWKPEQASTQ